ncbi:hypothetical protein WA026_016352 [Henosepilachna vigintioctopunctata]|uniref:CUB domain-containing protein n=1 Tax=Henosepilachna vigintioctopunctata TaxID=420089 RepID=A0AAW1UFK7_9CUCU
MIKTIGFGIGLVRFANAACTSGDGLEGVCRTRRECARIGGTGSGRCVNGIAVCCVVQKYCGDVTTSNSTYFANPNFPNLYNGGTICTFTIRKLSDDICQARIDFIAFTLAQPDANGLCATDGLTITGGASTVPTICGDNAGQHIYVDFNGNSTIQLNIFTGIAANSRVWNFKVSQIGCDCPTRAPSGCLMYYTTLMGTVRSFNYGTTGNAAMTRQLANQNYGVCIAMQPGYCSINWAQTAGDLYSFTVTGDSPTAVTTGTAGTNAVIGALCTTDFVVIPNPTFTGATPGAANVDRFCGNAFQPLTTNSKPFVLTVVNDANEVGDIGNRGFSLDFTQQRCNNVPVIG